MTFTCTAAVVPVVCLYSDFRVYRVCVYVCVCAQEAWLLSRERELKEEVRRGRDKEIELAIQRLEEETSGARDECDRAADNRLVISPLNVTFPCPCLCVCKCCKDYVYKYAYG